MLALTLACWVCADHGREVQGISHEDQREKKENSDTGFHLARSRMEIARRDPADALARVLVAFANPVVHRDVGPARGLSTAWLRSSPRMRQQDDRQTSEICEEASSLPGSRCKRADMPSWYYWWPRPTHLLDASDLATENHLSWRGLSPSIEAALGFKTAVDTLKIEIQNLLHDEPDWSHFAEDMRLIDHSGDELKGLGANKRFLKLLRRLCEKFAVKDDIQVHFLSLDPGTHQMSFDDRGFEEQFDNLLVANWEVQVDKRILPVDIALETIFHLNSKNQIDYVKIDKLTVKGVFGRHVPKLKLSGDRASNLKKLKEWGQRIKELELLSADELESLRSGLEACYELDAVDGLEEEKHHGLQAFFREWQQELQDASRLVSLR